MKRDSFIGRRVITAVVSAFALAGCAETGVRSLGSVDCAIAKGPVTASDYSSKRDLLAIGRAGGEFEVRSPAPDHLLACGAHEHPMSNLAISPDGQQLVTTDTMGTVALSQIDDEDTRVLRQEPEEVLGLAWSPSGKSFVTATRSYVTVWHLEDLTRREVHMPYAIGAVAFAPDEKRLVVAGSRLAFLDLKTLTLSGNRPLPSTPTDVRFSPNGHLMAVLMLGGIAFWDGKAPTLDTAVRADLSWDPIGVRFAPNGSVAVFERDSLYQGPPSANQVATEIQPAAGYISDAEFKRDGSLMVFRESEGYMPSREIPER